MFPLLLSVFGFDLTCAKKCEVPRFLQLNRCITTYQYGSHPSQIIEVIPRKNPREDMPLAPEYVTVFFHGGAWGSGTPKFYRLFGDILTRMEGHTVVLIGYRIYPVGSVEDQIEDLGLGLKWLEDNRERIGLFHTTPVILSAHSSGSHIGSVYLIRRSLNPEQFVGHAVINGFISMSGVFDIWAQYRVEEFRGFQEISPLKGCTGPELHHMMYVCLLKSSWSPLLFLQNGFSTTRLLNSPFSSLLFSLQAVQLNSIGILTINPRSG